MLGKNIARLRKAKGLTQSKFAEMIHVTQGAISQWETGRTTPDVQQMFILADFFGITVEELSAGTISQATTEKEITPAERRAEAKQLIDGMDEKQYQVALELLRFVKSRKE